MTINAYVLVNGTCTAAPGEHLVTPPEGEPKGLLEQIADGERQRAETGWGRTVSGGGNVVLIQHPDGHILIDSGDYDDKDIFLRSIERLESELKSFDILDDTRYILHTHTHPDHIGFSYLFPNAELLISENDGLLTEVLAIESGNGKFNDAWAWYEQHRKNNMSAGLFTRIADNDERLARYGIHVKTFNGHQAGQLAARFAPAGSINLTYVETGETLVVPELVFGGDIIVDKRYWQEFVDGMRRIRASERSGKPLEAFAGELMQDADGNPLGESAILDALRNSIYTTSFYRGEEKEKQGIQAIKDVFGLAGFAGKTPILPGHGRHFQAAYENGR